MNTEIAIFRYLCLEALLSGSVRKCLKITAKPSSQIIENRTKLVIFIYVVWLWYENSEIFTTKVIRSFAFNNVVIKANVNKYSIVQKSMPVIFDNKMNCDCESQRMYIFFIRASFVTYIQGWYYIVH